MFANAIRRKSFGSAVVRTALAAALTLAGAGAASAYVGPSFLQIPGADGGWQGQQYKSWFKVDGNYWADRPDRVGGGMRRPNMFSPPGGGRQGAGRLVVAVDKDNPVLPRLMDKCTQKTSISELTYAESTELGRTTFEIGARPADIPEYYEYKLKDVQFSDCPVVADAPQQAFVVTFKDIERLNYKRPDDAIDAELDPVPLAPAPSDAKTKSFVLTWVALAHDISDDQCPKMNEKPTEDDYYALVSKDDADKERAELKEKGGVSYLNGQMGLRGPHRLNVTMMPGIVKDPGDPEPQTKLARGLDLDGNDGMGAAPAGTCKHANYASADGRAGIDNQLYRAQGCIGSFQGHKGFYMQFSNTQMRDGGLSMLVQVTGIDNEKNDDSVDVTLFYSLDPMVKTAAGDKALPDYTYRLTDEPRYTSYFTRLHGRIVNGVLITDPVNELRMNLGQYGTPVSLKMRNASIRLDLASDGTIKGVVGGYQDWRLIASRYVSSQAEQVHNFPLPGLYNALKRNADGLKDPVTGQCNGISSAYDIEGIPAFIEPATPKPAPPKVAKSKDKRQLAQAESRGEKAQ